MEDKEKEIFKLDLAMAVGEFVDKFPIGTLTNQQYYSLVDFIRNYKEVS